MDCKACLINAVILSAAALQSHAIAQLADAEMPTPPADTFWDHFKDPLDGRFDVTAGGGDSGTAGLVPLAIPGNEPTFGPSLLMALVYFHENNESSPPPAGTPPTMTFGGAGFTENESWAVAGGHYAVRNQGRHRYLGLLGAASVNLGFYGLDASSPLRENPLDFKMEGVLLVQGAQFRLGDSNFFAGGNITLLSTETAFEVTPEEDLVLGSTTDIGLTASLDYDTRDNSFTPSSGTTASAAASVFSDSLGGDFSYQKLDLKGIHYWRLREERLSLGLRMEYHYASDGVPFYLLPWVSLRGIPILRYPGNHAVTTEIEPRYQLDERWSVLGFAGIGRAASHFDDLSDSERAYNYGIGFRYLIARQLGLAAGLDLARGPEGSTLYLTFGNAWGL